MFVIEVGIAMPEEKFLTFEEFYNLIENQKYRSCYEKLVNRAKERTLEGYSERHHIIPRCLKGNNEEENLVYLTAREHYIAHQILVILFPKVYRLAYAAQLMTVDALGNRVDNRMYGWLRERLSEAQKNRVYSEETRRNMSNGQKNRILTLEQKERMMIGLRKGWETPITSEQRAKMSASMKGRKLSPEHIEKMRIINTGRKASEETRAKMRGRVCSEETRAKQIVSATGRKHTEESKAKIAENNIRRGVSKETKAKMSEVHRNMSDERKVKIGAAGKISRQREKELGLGMYSKESIAKRSASIKASWALRKSIFIESEISYDIC